MEEYLQLFKNEANLYNHIILGSLLPTSLWEPLPHFLRTWLRNYIAASLFYLSGGSLWSFFIYYIKPNLYIRHEDIPLMKTMSWHIYESMKSMPWYAALPTLSEHMIENGWTRCFSSISEVGWFAYFVYLVSNLAVVEVLIYWSHRLLHDIKPLYNYLHAHHHRFNTKKLISPFVGAALHPLDGLFEALPHLLVLFVVPTQMGTHLGLLFVEAFWIAQLHDCTNRKLWPIMGTDYHFIHHKTNRHNYGHYTIFMDWMFGTLSHPTDSTTKKKI